MSKIDHKNKIYNDWTVLEYVGIRGRDAVWKCRCKCGLEKDLKVCNLINGASKRCISCSRISKEYNEVVPTSYWNKIIRRSNNKFGYFNLSKEEATNLFIKQEGKCALTGLDISFSKNGFEDRAGKQTASLDRKNSNKDYSIRNVQWVHKDVNRMKNIFEEDYYIAICKAVALKNKENEYIF